MYGRQAKVPEELQTSKDARRVFCGAGHTCLLSSTQRLSCFGSGVCMHLDVPRERARKGERAKGRKGERNRDRERARERLTNRDRQRQGEGGRDRRQRQTDRQTEIDRQTDRGKTQEARKRRSQRKREEKRGEKIEGGGQRVAARLIRQSLVQPVPLKSHIQRHTDNPKIIQTQTQILNPQARRRRKGTSRHRRVVLLREEAGGLPATTTLPAIVGLCCTISRSLLHHEQVSSHTSAFATPHMQRHMCRK